MGGEISNVFKLSLLAAWSCHCVCLSQLFHLNILIALSKESGKHFCFAHSEFLSLLLSPDIFFKTCPPAFTEILYCYQWSILSFPAMTKEGTQNLQLATRTPESLCVEWRGRGCNCNPIMPMDFWSLLKLHEFMDFQGEIGFLSELYLVATSYAYTQFFLKKKKIFITWVDLSFLYLKT